MKREIEDIFLVADYATLDKPPCDVHERLFVDEEAIDDVVFRMLPVPREGPDAVDHPLGLCGLPLSVRQHPQAREQLLLLRTRLLTPYLEASCPGAGLEVLDVAQDGRYERARAF